MPIILATWEAETRRTEVPGQPGQKFCETPSQPTAGCGVVGGSKVQASPGTKIYKTSISKKKKLGVVATAGSIK
jgi:hypothetical protein